MTHQGSITMTVDPYDFFGDEQQDTQLPVDMPTVWYRRKNVGVLRRMSFTGTGRLSLAMDLALAVDEDLIPVARRDASEGDLFWVQLIKPVAKDDKGSSNRILTQKIHEKEALIQQLETDLSVYRHAWRDINNEDDW